MDARLHEAALMGDVDSLSTLLEGNANILDGAADFAETPLHIAALFDHVEFAKIILRRKPELTRVLDSERSSPLHLASAEGHVEMVKELLKIDPDMCLVRDKDGRIPLHVAALNGHEDLVKVLVDKKRTATRVLTRQREPILHLCVNHNRFDSVKWLLDCVEDGKDNEFVKMKDDERNTILHLAVAKKHIKLTEFLVRKTVMRVKLNALNAHGFTALDILLQNRGELKDMKLEGILRGAGAKKGGAMHPTRDDWTIKPLSSRNEKWKKHGDWLNEIRSSIMVVAVLIATVTFQAGFTPPGGLVQVETSDAPQLGYPTSPAPACPIYTGGKSIMAIKYPCGYNSS
ncbi:ankyrin repeat-containing protein BDA1-like isoform X1 [Magnolia sinica]|uniref:ankyrin repeat-containing protein BDA1-like isoform X1 n=1 Tax=Magnolia sinica TaxID=86752 RepID=UPI002659BEDC|nr:ankyrin repeat-containing protein BDA1-like isoform X1 [Magnolia sinica]